MLKTQNPFNAIQPKRRVLVADDEIINRELLGAILESDYEVLYAENGEEALRLCRENASTLSLMLLDLMMPVMSGLEVLKRLQEDPALKRIPVIVLTADQAAEVESLALGATDFIPKPYPQAKVILARVLRTIELFEDREIISSTERDPLTGLYNREFFYRYAAQLDQRHAEAEMDAIVVDVNHFHMINERFGTDYGDQVLRRIGENLMEAMADRGGIACRREADTFLLYCPHIEDYDALLARASADLAEDSAPASRVRLRMGVYPCADQALDIERRFDRAQVASELVQDNYARKVGIYDDALHERELLTEQLVEDFRSAIDEEQFAVFFQPKFNVRGNVPRLASCEALVRWQHPKLGFISPGTFIPLFEENGLIRALDNYVWRKSASQIRDWKDRLGYSVPVSVNVSRIDLFDPNLIPTLQGILQENGLTCEDLLLEITESAYTQDSEQIIRTAERLRAEGLKIEMDDFGSGYSSLNMLSRLPIDALKLDMHFIRTALDDPRHTRMLEAIVDIAGNLSAPVIAEGVELAEQLRRLKSLGCDIVQGYYFSKPVPADEFERFLLEARAAEAEAQKAAKKPPEEAPAEVSSADVEPPEDIPAHEADKTRHGLQLRTTSFFFVVIALLAAVALFIADISVTNGYQRMQRASNRYIVAQMAASNMESGSDYLTDRVRCFVVTGEIAYLQDFFEEVEVTQRRDKALSDLEALLEGSESSAYNSLSTALQLSNELLHQEYHAMRLMLESQQYDLSDIPEEILAVELSQADLALTAEEKKEKAQTLVFDNNYMHYKDRIRENVSLCTQELIRSSSLELEQASAKMSLFVHIQTAMTVVFLLIVLLIVVFINVQVRRPLTRMVEWMRAGEAVPPVGAEELQFVTRTYNAILSENKAARERLSHEASHDKLTGLFNRGAYEMLLKSVDTAHMALLLIDVDYFKTVNDTYGHDVGDRVLKRVADILKHSFRSVDIICRIGGDEFVVIMTRVDSSMRDLVIRKIEHANELLQNPEDDLPPVSLSVGAAFADRKNPKGDIFKDADTALYRVKAAGRCGCRVF